jgi:hypothetical protein
MSWTERRRSSSVCGRLSNFSGWLLTHCYCLPVIIVYSSHNEVLPEPRLRFSRLTWLQPEELYHFNFFSSRPCHVVGDLRSNYPVAVLSLSCLFGGIGTFAEIWGYGCDVVYIHDVVRFKLFCMDSVIMELSSGTLIYCYPLDSENLCQVRKSIMYTKLLCRN